MKDGKSAMKAEKIRNPKEFDLALIPWGEKLYYITVERKEKKEKKEESLKQVSHGTWFFPYLHSIRRTGLVGMDLSWERNGKKAWGLLLCPCFEL